MTIGTIVTLALVALALVPLFRQRAKGGSSCADCAARGGCDGSCSAAKRMVADMEKADRKAAREERRAGRKRMAVAGAEGASS